MAVGAQELHLGHTLVLEGIAVVTLLKHADGRIDARYGYVQTVPHVADIPVGCQHALLHLKLVEDIAVVHRTTTLIGIVRAHVVVPH